MLPPAGPPKPKPDRLGTTFDQRLLLAQASSFFCGFTLGTFTAGHAASLRFRAENAHRLPTTQPGWYLYHKSKNYYKAKYGIIEGVRKGFFVAAWTSVFFLLEESIDVFRGTWRAGRTLREMEGVDELSMKALDQEVARSRDFWSSTVAGMVGAGLWSAWNQFPMVTAARTIRMGLGVGMAYGLSQDAVAYAKKRWVPEVEEGESWIYKKRKEGVEEEDGKGGEHKS
ncbi:hypothetical protein P154DRAFT_422860 [Amniculicola lignicola CBS 123094]|uniref:Uncharacterized protein n=1 Tax=Amniculicola lignicola CBS 123094 TaxID=1392246 RepID=A0A6A5WXL6_9PLEO|nr:hypothetical protein P154DRAFT_422860 [Amniculicola lignicola CBS 123094]